MHFSSCSTLPPPPPPRKRIKCKHGQFDNLRFCCYDRNMQKQMTLPVAQHCFDDVCHLSLRYDFRRSTTSLCRTRPRRDFQSSKRGQPLYPLRPLAHQNVGEGGHILLRVEDSYCCSTRLFRFRCSPWVWRFDNIV